MAKRDLSNRTLEIDATADTPSMLNTDPTPPSSDTKDGALSDNISLFQSLRVLQEGEEEDNDKDTANVQSKFPL